MTRRTPPAARRQRDPERTRQRILEAATTEFAAKGYAGARVGQIADRAGVNKQLISYYFGGKDGLYREITDQWLRGESAAAESRAELPLSELTASYVRDSPAELVRLLLWEGLTAEKEDAEDPGEAVRNTRMTAAVEDIRRRQRDGELADDIDPRAFLLAFITASAGPIGMPHLVRSIYGDDADPESADFVAAYADQIARMVTHLTARSD